MAAQTRRRVVAVVSNKGGVGKTTVATNLAIYLRALDEALPVLLVGLDDQLIVDRMFTLEPLQPEAPNLKHGWAERSLDRVIRLGQYGVHFVGSPPETEGLKSRAEDPRTLGRVLAQTRWDGVVILDTKSDLEGLTRNALYAADRVVIPVADRSSLEEAGKVFALLEQSRRGADRGRVLLTLADARTRVDLPGGPDLSSVLEGELARRGWPRYRTALSRSPRAEALISAGGEPLSILHHGRGTAIHRQLREFADEVVEELGLERLEPGDETLGFRAPPEPLSARRPTRPRLGVTDWKSALLRGGRGR